MRTLSCFFFLFASYISIAQCTTTDGTSCVCEDGSNDCDLLPDITISWYGIESFMGGPNEFAQSGAGVNNARLKITGSTPNIGHGPLTVRGTNYFVCGGDTVIGDPGICPDGSSPKRLIEQRIYHRNPNGTMTYTDVFSGAMTFHPTHNHNHVDDWGYFSLRIEDPNESDPRKWPIVGTGSKIGFCLMDYGTCSSYNGHCKDDNTVYNNGTTLLNGDFPNWGLGGGNYNCSVVEQGISVGWTDIYSENLDGMWIDIPPGTCNGDYYIVAEIDPKHHFLEEDTTNNWTAVPITLTLQDTPGNPDFKITSDLGNEFCLGNTATLKAPAGFNYIWNTGDTTQNIQTDTSGTYTVSLTNYCGTAVSSPLTITTLPTPMAPIVNGDTLICAGQSTVLSANASSVRWYDDNNFNVGSGSTFTTPSLISDRTYYAEVLNITAGASGSLGITDTASAGGGYFNGSQHMLFDVLTPIRLKSFKVYANGAGVRDIQVLDIAGNLVAGGSYNLPDGESVVNVDYDIPVGINFRITVSSPNPNLYRSNVNVNYPYEVQDTLIIQSSTGGNGFYYYFYDWNFEVGTRECAGPRTPFSIIVENCMGVDALTSLDHLLTIYPNPNDGGFKMTFTVPGTSSFNFKITDILGNSVYTEEVSTYTGNYQKQFNLADLHKGVYLLTVYLGNQSTSQRFVIQ